jgi:4-amino-4-deoxy-L-arabinose transferase-like glycosyltransferase
LRWARGNPALLALGALTLAGALLRLLFLVRYRPALLGFSDSINYILSAHGALFSDPARPAGYVLFLRLLHVVSNHLLLVSLVQHLLGLAGGLLLFDAVRRTGAPRALGLVPAAVVMLGGSEVILEHAVMPDALFTFLVVLALWLIVRAWDGSLWWAIAAGAALGSATIVRTVGLEVLPFALVGLYFSPIRRRRWRLASVSTALAGSLLVIVPFLIAHRVQSGSFDFTSSGNTQLYGRVAPWADCSKFTPPKGTANLCISTPVADRAGGDVWLYSPTAPLLKAYGIYTKGMNGKLGAFSFAAVLGQPLEYLQYVARDLVRVVDPTFSSSPYPKIGNRGYGATPDLDLSVFFDTSQLPGREKIVNQYYNSPGLIARSVGFFKSWDRDTRLEGPLMALILVLAVFAPVLSSGVVRRFALLTLTTSAALIIGPIIVHSYDWRYTVPAFGPLTAAASIGGLELVRRARAAVTARLADGSVSPAAPEQPAPQPGD